MPKSSPSTQDFIQVKTIEDDVVILKNGGLRQIIIVSGLNLDLMSEEEQGSILSLYQRFLNTLDFPVQFLVHSRKFDIENYIKNMDVLEQKETNELLRNQIFEYKEFIKTFVAQNDIMTKMFLVVVSYNAVTLVSQKGWLGSLFSKSKKTKQVSADEILQGQEKNIHFRQLKQRSDQVISGLQSIGLRALALNTEELTELFYNFYNPEAVSKDNLNIAKAPTSPTANN